MIRARLSRAAELRLAAPVLGHELTAAQVAVLAAVLDGRAEARVHAPGVVGALAARGLVDVVDGRLRPSRELEAVLQ